MTSARKLHLALAVLDVASVLLVFNLVSFLRGAPFAGHFIVWPLLGPLIALVVAFSLIDGYSIRTDMLSLDYTSQHVIATASALAAIMLVTFVVMPAGYELQSSRVVIALSYLVLAPLTLSFRRVLYQRVLARRVARSFVFLGDEASCREFREQCEVQGMVQRVIFAVVNDASRPPFPDSSGEPPRLFGDVLDDIQQRGLPVEAIVLRESARELPPDLSRRLVELFFKGVPTYTLELFHQVYWRKIPLYRLNQTWLFQEGFQIAREPVFERVKRATDIGFAAFGLVICAPFILLGALAVWLDDRGPAFFSQSRIGKNHVPFRLYKLRTMRVNAGGSLYTKPDDERITRVGRFLRATRIDEFPQLWNVLRGDMSVIGPRAEWDQLVEGYEREIPCYHFRHLVKPGITGWAQVNYPYGANIEDTLRKLEYDLYYIRHFSFVLDASIVLKTIHVMLFGKGR
jgi:exopolysaccharide biosynthesis polyprenyl glycosylphosphotransferase